MAVVKISLLWLICLAIHDSIQVKDDPKGRPEVSVDSQNPREGDLVTFTCSIHNVDSHLPIIRFNWARNGIRLNEWPNDRKVEIKMIRGLDGNYSCSVENLIGFSVSAEPVYINILYGPTGKPVLEVNITGAVDQGQYVAFTCATNGNITSNPGINSVRLIKDEKPSVRQSHDFIFIIMVTDADSGVYYCILGNTIGFSKFSNFREIKVKIEKGLGGSGEGGSTIFGIVLGSVLGSIFVICVMCGVVFILFRRKPIGDRTEESADSSAEPHVNEAVELDDAPHEYAEVREVFTIITDESLPAHQSTNLYENAAAGTDYIPHEYLQMLQCKEDDGEQIYAQQYEKLHYSWRF